ncbi:helix-turn-helix domain-containing protein [Klebsiella michiganensis]|uniref:helix-turn-helix domain-containing protein n=1 Tax=Klebsiella michiganensis TaxID=1134687 RepID=UPI00148280D6|nr:helix-turn-helix domain-containing protein [Klebsiella michiganensis]NNS03387.1 hypothetical protein [Klebsiella michiganensis]
MYNPTFDNNSDSLRKSLSVVSIRYFPQSNVHIEHSDLRYDSLMAGDTSGFEDKNESYILIRERDGDCMVINIICLHIESLRIAIRTERALLSEENVRVFLSEVKILLLTEVINYQNTMFTKISDNTWHLASGLSHEVVTQHVIDGALKTIAYSDAAIFRIYDDKSDRLVPVAMTGFKNNYYDYIVGLHESISGKVFKSMQTAVLNSREEINHSFTASSSLRDEILKDNPLATSLICVPVYDQSACYGTLTMLSFSRQFVFNSLAKSLLETYSSQVALAWRNARLYDERTESLRVVEDLRNQLQAQNTLLNASVDFYNLMVSLSIKYNRLGDFIAAIASHLSLDLNYLDVLGNQSLSESLSALTWSHLRASAGEKNVSTIIVGDRDYCLLPLENEGRLLAFFIMRNPDLNEHVSSIISRLKEFVIMEIVKQAGSVALENKKNLDLIAEIMVIGLTAESEISFARRGIVLHKSVLCIKLTAPQVTSDEIHYLSTINVLTRDFALKNVFHYFDAEVITLIIFDMNEQKLFTLEEKVIARYQQDKLYKVGVSSVLRRQEVITSIKQANTALDVLKTRNKSGVMSFRHSGIDRLFIKHTPEELKDFILDLFSPVLEENNKPGILLVTIICFLKNRQSAVNTAEEMGIHVNTLYQRIKKFETLTGLSLNNADEFIMIALTCHMSRFYLS